jgi:ABC-type amino acid transport substrate-binding protein
MLFYSFNTNAYRTYASRHFPLSNYFFVRLLILLLACSAGIPFAEANPKTSAPQVTNIAMWNGNKTDSRQEYEREVLSAALAATNKTHGAWNLTIDNTDYPAAEDEASVFRTKGFDIFGTVAGNQKLANEQKILIPLPLMKGLLGYRILIVRADEREKFGAIKTAKELQKLRLGIPSTWADAELFRQNGYPVVEKGGFDEIFTRLRNKEFDYVSFGANEVDGVFAERAASAGQLVIEQSLLVYYPFPLVFYVNPKNKALAERVTQGLTRISSNGELDKIFKRYFGKGLVHLKLNERQMIKLSNPMLPSEMVDFKPGL